MRQKEETDRVTERQWDRQTERQREEKTGRETEVWDGQRHRETELDLICLTFVAPEVLVSPLSALNGQRDRERDWETERQRAIAWLTLLDFLLHQKYWYPLCPHSSRQRDRETERQRDRETESYSLTYFAWLFVAPEVLVSPLLALVKTLLAMRCWGA